MLNIIWSPAASRDLVRLYRFLEGVNRAAAEDIVEAMLSAPEKIATNPRLGELINLSTDREIRRLLVGSYEMRYELKEETAIVLRVFHTREMR